MKLKASDKKWLLLVLGGLAALVLYLTQLSPTYSNRSTHQNDGAFATPETQTVAADQDRDSRPGKSRTGATEGDASRKVITHQAADFTRGEEQVNILVKDGLQMGDDPTFVHAVEPGRFFGVYLSPEEKTLEPFDGLMLSYDATIPENSFLEWAFRIKPEGGEWSDWREVSTEELNQPILFEASGLSWQYRLTFYVNAGAASPQVRQVTVTTLRSDSMQLSMNSSPISPQATPPRQITNNQNPSKL